VTDLDQRITSVLREHAEGETDPQRLLRTSRALGRRRQLRRRVVTGTALALVGVLGFVGVAGTDLGGLPGRLPWTAASPVVDAPVPPRADGVPGALTDPTRVGTDPQVLHFGVDPDRARYRGWAVQAMGVEQVKISVGDGPPVIVEVARSADSFTGVGLEGFAVDVAEARPRFDGSVRTIPGEGTEGGLLTWWQPGPGLYARAGVIGRDRAALTRAVGALRWDEARRCAAPVRLTTLPAGSSVAGCSVDVSSFPGSLTTTLTVYGPRPATMHVTLQYAAQMAGSRATGNRTVAGRPAFADTATGTLELLGLPKAHLTAAYGWPRQGFTEADAVTVLAGARVAGDLTRPGTWD
jgi:hypothetical protein